MVDEENVNKKECIFSFAKINKYYLFPFLAPLFCMISNHFLHLINIQNNPNNNNQEFILIIFTNLAFIIGGLSYFISFIRNKTEQIKNNAIISKERKTLNLIYNEGYKTNKKKIFGILFLMSILLSIYIICNCYSYGKIVFEKRLYYLFFISIFSRCILKNQIFRHQILSLTLAFIGLIILFLPVIQMIKIEDISLNIFNIFSAAFYSLFLVLVKYLTHKYFLSPYLCLLLVGCFSLILTLIGFIIYSLIKNNDFTYVIPKFDSSQNKIGVNYYIYAALSLFFSSLLQIFSFLVIYYFSPILLVVTDIISPMLTWVVETIQDPHIYYIIIFNSIGYFFELIAAFIYNEIIICNFCGLNEFTKKCIEERQNRESNALRMDYNDNDNESDITYNSDI